MAAELRTALITGGGTGIGRAIALVLASRLAGIGLALNYSKSKAEAEETAAQARALGARVLLVQADVADDEQVRAMVRAVAAEFGGVDYLVNNAGWTQFVPAGDLEALTDDIWDRCWGVNVKGAFYCVRAVVPLMRARGGGAIVNIASAAGIHGQGSNMAYCASKAALILLTKSLARVLAPQIRVNCVAPGVVDTRWVAGQEAFKRGARAKTPMRRIATPEDVAAAVVPLLLDMQFVTGQVLPVDGGLTY